MTMGYTAPMYDPERDKRVRAAQLYKDKADSGTFTLAEMHQLAAEAADPNYVPPPERFDDAPEAPPKGPVAAAPKAVKAPQPRAAAPAARKKTIDQELADLMGLLKGSSTGPAEGAAQRANAAAPSVNATFRGKGKSDYSPTGKDLMEGEKLLQAARGLGESPTATAARPQDASATAAAFNNAPKEEENPYLRALARLRGGI